MVSDNLFRKLVFPIGLLLIWELLALVIKSQFILPDLTAVLAVLLSPGSDVMGGGSLLDNALISLQRVGLGCLAATCLAVPLGLDMGRFEAVRCTGGDDLCSPSHTTSGLGSARAGLAEDPPPIHGLHHRPGSILSHPSKHYAWSPGSEEELA
jgi:hypothetical protein